MDNETRSLLLNLGASAADVMSRLVYKRDQAGNKQELRYVCKKVEIALSNLQKAVDKANGAV